MNCGHCGAWQRKCELSCPRFRRRDAYADLEQPRDAPEPRALDPWEREPGPRAWTCRRCGEPVSAFVELCKVHEKERLEEKDRQRALGEYEEWRRKVGDIWAAFRDDAPQIWTRSNVGATVPSA